MKELGLDDSTIVFFSSDNGPHKEGGADPAFFHSSGPLRGYKRDLHGGRHPRADDRALAGQNAARAS